MMMMSRHLSSSQLERSSGRHMSGLSMSGLSSHMSGLSSSSSGPSSTSSGPSSTSVGHLVVERSTGSVNNLLVLSVLFENLRSMLKSVGIRVSSSVRSHGMRPVSKLSSSSGIRPILKLLNLQRMVVHDVRHTSATVHSSQQQGSGALGGDNKDKGRKLDT